MTTKAAIKRAILAFEAATGKASAIEIDNGVIRIVPAIHTPYPQAQRPIAELDIRL
jgi:hypothetical protein